MKIEEIQKIAHEYFNGTISPGDERVLLAFISESEEHERMFRQWEAEWESHPQKSATIDEAWGNVAAQMMAIDEQAESPQKRTALQVAIRYAQMVAAAVIFLVAGAIGVWQYFAHQPADYFACTAPAGSKTCVVLPDSSRVWLNAGSTLKYSTRFGRSDRHVILDGEAYFEVKKQNGETFTVATYGYDVVVRGTRFDVRAYKDEPRLTTSLLQGKVDIQRGDERLMSLNPGEMAVLDRATGSLTKDVAQADSHGWVRGKMEFDNITFYDLMRIINRQYGVNIHTNSPELGNTVLSVSLRNDETVDDIIEAIRLLGNVKVTRRGKDILVH